VTANIEAHNNIVLGRITYQDGAPWLINGTPDPSFTINATGSNNFGGSNYPFPVSLQPSIGTSEPTANFVTASGAGNHSLYMGESCKLVNDPGFIQ